VWWNERGATAHGRRCSAAQCSDTDRRVRRGAVRRSAFTLIELLVVIAIIAVLAAVVAPAVFRNVGDAKTRAAQSQIEIFALALDSYRLDNDQYPTTQQGLDALRNAPTATALGADAPRTWRGPYLRKAVPLDPWGHAYVYVSPGRVNPKSYDLYTLGRDGRIGGTDEDADITSWGGTVTP
jgi:general secretion pathway protein G